jgi:hypothetical protein
VPFWDPLGCCTHGSERVGGLAAVRSLADRDWKRGSARAGNGAAMVQVWMQVQVHMQEWVWVWELLWIRRIFVSTIF